VGGNDAEGRRAGAAAGEFEQGLILGYQDVGAGGGGGFEEFLIVAVAALGELGALGGGLDGAGEAAALGEGGGLGGGVEGAAAELAAEDAGELGGAGLVDEHFGAAGGDGGAERREAGIVENEPVQPDVGVQHQS